jgi:hypothetical protein
MFSIVGTASEARAIADEIAGWCDWAAVTLDTARFLDARVTMWAREQRVPIIASSSTIGPWAERVTA